MAIQLSDKNLKWQEATAAVILSLASILTARSSYQATQWSRTMALTSGSVSAKLMQSTQLVILGSQDTMVDVITFTNWLEAISVENQPLADFYRSRFRDEFKSAFEAWLDLDPLNNSEAPSAPFAMTVYSPARMQATRGIPEEAGELQKEIRSASGNAASYVRNTLFLAVSLFLVGIGRIFSAAKVRLAIQILAFSKLLLSIFYLLIGEIA